MSDTQSRFVNGFLALTPDYMDGMRDLILAMLDGKDFESALEDIEDAQTRTEFKKIYFSEVKPTRT